MPQQDHIHIDGMCLNPAACFPCYPTLTGQNFDAGPVLHMAWPRVPL